MRGFGRFLVGMGIALMVAALAYYGATETRTDTVAATAVWSFLLGTLVSVVGGIVNGRR